MQYLQRPCAEDTHEEDTHYLRILVANCGRNSATMPQRRTGS
jgi:hypothetical protein